MVSVTWLSIRIKAEPKESVIKLLDEIEKFAIYSNVETVEIYIERTGEEK